MTMSGFICTYFEFDELGSTNDKIAELLRAGDVHLPALVRCHKQRAGRGQGSNLWWSDEGSLTFSIGFDPRTLSMSQDQEPRLALASAVAVVNALEALEKTSAFRIRWPNDIEHQSKKVGGILVEPLETFQGRRLIVGIGLNVS